MIKHSIIVPIYRVERYLRKCVDSLLKQDLPLSEYEIILVDDGSPDGCPQICDEYAATYKNIHVIHCENGGLSAARNRGVEVAQGKYIMFVDSDDYIEPNVLGGLLTQVEREQLDVLRYDYQNVRIADSEYEVFQPYKHPHEVDMREDVVDGLTYMNNRMGYRCYVTQFIVKREIVPLFTDGIHFEDVDWLPRMMLKAKRVNSTETLVYNYLHRLGSITQTHGDKARQRKNIDDRMLVIVNLTSLYKFYPDCQWILRMRSSLVAGTMMSVAQELYEDRDKYIDYLSKLKVLPLEVADQGRTYERRARLINILGLRLYCHIMHWCA